MSKIQHFNQLVQRNESEAALELKSSQVLHDGTT